MRRTRRRQTFDEFERRWKKGKVPTMRPAERAAWERFQLGKRLHPGASMLEFRHTPSGWIVTPDFRGKAGRNKAGSWQARLVALEQRLMKLELERIARTL